MRHLEALAAFFGVPVAYFFDAEVAARADADLELVVALSSRMLRDLALDAAGLSPDSLSAVAAVVTQLRRAEGSPARPAENATSTAAAARSERRRPPR
jgi:hypothetical protein